MAKITNTIIPQPIMQIDLQYSDVRCILEGLDTAGGIGVNLSKRREIRDLFATWLNEHDPL